MPRFVRIVTALVSLSLLAGAAGCARPLPHVALPDVVLGEPSFFPTLEAFAGSPIVGGNAVEVLLNGEEIFPALVEAINSAQRTISYAQYFYEDGPVARDVAEALAERCRAGVGVNVLLDGFGTLNMPADLVPGAIDHNIVRQASRAQFGELIRGGIVARRLQESFLADIEASRQVTYESWKHRGVGSKMLEVLALPIRDLL
jgi:phosphatidylserine/phosphatidylglycerophosphate/cardiolipin synthase-like enzyme